MAVIQAIFTLTQKFCLHILRAESLAALMLQVRQHLAETRDAFRRYTGERFPLSTVQYIGPSYAPACVVCAELGACAAFLYTVLDKLAARGYLPHISELLLRLDFNSYYKKGVGLGVPRA